MRHVNGVPNEPAGITAALRVRGEIRKLPLPQNQSEF